MSQQPRNRIGATPGKLALIAILAVVLAVVIKSNSPSSSPPASHRANRTEPKPTAPTAARRAATPISGASSGVPQIQTSGNPFGEFAADDNWPEVAVGSATAFDPFAVAAWASPPGADGEGGILSEEQIQDLLAAKNAIIFMSGGTRLARIGDRELRIGDMIGRFRISDITSQGVILSEAAEIERN